MLKTGRTHLQDAVPITLGQEFSGYAARASRARGRCRGSGREQLHELNIGATAVGTGLNAGDDYRGRRREARAAIRSLPLTPADNLFRVTQSMGDVLAYSGAMRRLAVEVGKIASDLRLLSMGPRAGLAEITLPAVQPGSSIMPGKVNPSVPEMVNQVCFQVIGCDDDRRRRRSRSARAERDDAGDRVERAARHHDPRAPGDAACCNRCVDGIAADAARARELLDRSTAPATALSHIIYVKTGETTKPRDDRGAPIPRERG